MNFFTSKTNCLIAYATFCLLLFLAPYVYSGWHFEVRDPVDFYLDDKRDWERSHGIQDPYMSYGEWTERNEQRNKDFWRDLGEGAAYSFDPWYSPEQANYDHGRD